MYAFKRIDCIDLLKAKTLNFLYLVTICTVSVALREEAEGLWGGALRSQSAQIPPPLERSRGGFIPPQQHRLSTSQANNSFKLENQMKHLLTAPYPAQETLSWLTLVLIITLIGILAHAHASVPLATVMCHACCNSIYKRSELSEYACKILLTSLFTKESDSVGGGGFIQHRAGSK